MQYDYFIGGELIQTSTMEKDLGIQVHKSLKVAEHVNFVVKKANGLLGCIRRTYTDKSLTNIIQLYQTLVRPLLETCVPAWSPYLQKDIEKLESVQRRATRMISSVHGMPYESRLKKCKLMTLKDRRLRTDLIEVFKIIHGFTDIPTESLTT